MDHFRDIAPFDIVNLYDEFYNDRIYFLFPILEMLSFCGSCLKGIASIGRNYPFLIMPTQQVVLNETFFNSALPLPQYNDEIN